MRQAFGNRSDRFLNYLDSQSFVRFAKAFDDGGGSIGGLFLLVKGYFESEWY